MNSTLTSDQYAAARQAFNALVVIALDSRISRYLRATDPKALEQVIAAANGLDILLDAPHQQFPALGAS